MAEASNGMRRSKIVSNRAAMPALACLCCPRGRGQQACGQQAGIHAPGGHAQAQQAVAVGDDAAKSASAEAEPSNLHVCRVHGRHSKDELCVRVLQAQRDNAGAWPCKHTAVASEGMGSRDAAGLSARPRRRRRSGAAGQLLRGTG
jgi:hypothetical protein